MRRKISIKEPKYAAWMDVTAPNEGVNYYYYKKIIFTA
jgi:hypothetical protein